MLRCTPRSTLFPTRRSSDLHYRGVWEVAGVGDCQESGPRKGVRELSSQAPRRAENCIVKENREIIDRKSTRLNSSHRCISYAVFCLKKKKKVMRTEL